MCKEQRGRYEQITTQEESREHTVTDPFLKISFGYATQRRYSSLFMAVNNYVAEALNFTSFTYVRHSRL